MGKDSGRTTLSGTGNKTILTFLTGAPTSFELHTVSGQNICYGVTDGTGNQAYLQSGPSGGSGTGKIIFLQDSGGATVMEGTLSSFGTSGGSGTVVINLTTNTSARAIVWKAEN